MAIGIQDEQYPSLHNAFSFSDFLLQLYPELECDVGSEQHAASFILTPEVLESEYENYKNVPFFDLTKERIALDKQSQLPEKSAYALNALALKHVPEGIIVGFVNPFDQDAVQSVQNIVNAFVKPVMVRQKDLMRMLRLTYRKIAEIQKYAERILVQPQVAETFELIGGNEDDQVSALAFLILKDAVEIEASDVHIEVTSLSLNIRLRIDGILQKYSLANVAIGDHLVRYFKLLADVDITQDQKPSEGKKVAIMIGHENMNVRISFMPTYDGQSIVIRILGKADSYSLRNKIANAEYYKKIKEYLLRSYGMFLISGPTGSGKTTTLYSSIQEINTPDKKIVTLEDPVEAKIPGVIQIQINETINYAFSDALRATLRQDPDVIMLGEIRDEVTANMAVRAAITGHLVLSTVHARGVSEIPIRLLNLKVDPYLLASALRLVVSQRLVRKICPNCKEEHLPTEMERIFLEKHANSLPKTATFYHGKGCYYCQQTGCAQREAIFEILHMTPQMITCLSLNAIAEYMQLAHKEIQGHTLLDNAFTLALNGVIPLSEVMRMESD